MNKLDQAFEKAGTTRSEMSGIIFDEIWGTKKKKRSTEWIVNVVAVIEQEGCLEAYNGFHDKIKSQVTDFGKMGIHMRVRD